MPLCPLPGVCSGGYQVELRDVHGPGSKTLEEGWPLSRRVIEPLHTRRFQCFGEEAHGPEEGEFGARRCCRKRGFLCMRQWEEEKDGVNGDQSMFYNTETT